MVKLIEKQVISKKEFDMILITDEVKKAVEESGITNGMVAVITKHTTTSIMVNESLPCVEKDIQATLERLVPTHGDYVHTHMLPTYGTCSGNAPGHLKSMLGGNHCIFPVQDGKLLRRFAQDIFLAEYDGPQDRTLVVVVIGE